jgi:hypothetical protein
MFASGTDKLLALCAQVRIRSGPAPSDRVGSRGRVPATTEEGFDHEPTRGKPAARQFRQVVEVITIAVLAMGLIFVMAGVVGVVDAARASAWRAVAAERRQSWEDRGGVRAAQAD